MTGGNARHGRRDNGLFAANYAVVGDVDPRIGEHLLDVLGNRGIAAYLQPTVDQHPITRVTTLPARPTDRLFVDRSELDTAREFLAILARDGDGATLTPQPADEANSSGSSASPSSTSTSAGGSTATPSTSSSASGSAPDDADTASDAVSASAAKPAAAGPTSSPSSRGGNDFEEAWASIVAGFDSGTTHGPTPWPAIEDLTAHGAGSTPYPPDPPPASPPISLTGSTIQWPRWTPQPEPEPERDNSLLDGLDSFGADLPDDDDDDYQPPAPPPLPHLAAITIIGMIGVLGGIAIIIYPNLLPGITSSGAAVFGCILIIAGAIALIGRLRSGADEDEPDDPDHGAIV